MPPCTMPSALACCGPGRKPRMARRPSIFSNHGPLASAKPMASVSSRKPYGIKDTRHLRRCPSCDTSQQDQAVADIVAGQRGDQPVRPDAELLVGQLLEQEPAERGADHRRGDGDGDGPRLDLPDLTAQRAE